MSAKNLTYIVSAPSGSLKARVVLPSSKSISNRVLVINSLSKSLLGIKNLSNSDDTHVLVKALEFSGTVFDIGHAGTAMRFLTALLACTPGEWIITGSARMKQRPIRILADSLRKLGAEVEYLEKEGCPPLRIVGKELKGGIIELDGSVSSQYISALLMIAPTLKGGLTLVLQNRITSRSYIEMTLKLMNLFGVSHTWRQNEIRIEEQKYAPVEYFVEADWSAASYWYEALALSPGGIVELPDLVSSELQGDQAIEYWFEWFGIETTSFPGGIRISKVNERCPSRLFLKFHETPDMAQTMASLCVAKRVPFHFTGLETLKIKETNRILALQNELGKLGAELTEPREGELKWNGFIDPSREHTSPVIETYNDHRMAMAFAPLASCGKVIRINDPEVVTKSYPSFWNDLKEAGFQIDIEKD